MAGAVGDESNQVFVAAILAGAAGFEIGAKGTDDFEVGDSVIYENPFFSAPVEAEVLEVHDNVIRVVFESDCAFNDGLYPKEFFSRAA